MLSGIAFMHNMMKGRGRHRTTEASSAYNFRLQDGEDPVSQLCVASTKSIMTSACVKNEPYKSPKPHNDRVYYVDSS